MCLSTKNYLATRIKSKEGMKIYKQKKAENRKSIEEALRNPNMSLDKRAQEQ